MSDQPEAPDTEQESDPEGGEEGQEESKTGLLARKKLLLLILLPVLLALGGGGYFAANWFGLTGAAQSKPTAKPAVDFDLPEMVVNLSSTDLDGSAGIFRLKEELLRRVNLEVHPHKVKRVLFKEIIIQ